jgi:hypothetical protein
MGDKTFFNEPMKDALGEAARKRSGAKEEGRGKREEREETGLTTAAVRDIRLF